MANTYEISLGLIFMAFQFSVVVFCLASLHKSWLTVFLLLSPAEQTHVKLLLSGVTVCKFQNVSCSGIGFMCGWWYMKLLMRDYWCLKYSLSLTVILVFPSSWAHSFCHYPSSRLLINTGIFEQSIHVSLLFNTMVATLKTYSTQIHRSKKNPPQNTPN